MYNITQQLQELLKKENIDGVLIRSTDQYFNEYVPKDKSIRVKITGFSGSLGDAIILKDSAHLFVDGRYVLQAKNESPEYEVHVAEGLSIESLWLKFLENLKPKKIAYDSSLIDLSLLDKMTSLNCFTPNASDLISKILDKKLDEKSYDLQKIPLDIAGLSVKDKLKRVKETFDKEKIDGFFLVKLDDIAWLTNLRGDYFPYQKTFPAKALVLKEEVLLLFDEKPKKVILPEEGIEIIKDFKELSNKKYLIGIDKNETSEKHMEELQLFGLELKAMRNPVNILKAIKNESEIRHLRKAFKKADCAVFNTIKKISENFNQEKAISEYDVKVIIEEEFIKEGANSLSFQPICAHKKNGAIIHYGSASKEEKLQNKSLFLLDTGAYFEGGYATDLTRTFLIAKEGYDALSWQKEMFTLVLKASIIGLSARIRVGSLGCELDARIREPLWQNALDFGHGTGHGIGINVHEFPPRIAPKSLTPLMPYQVFSIEPGLYFEGLGGVRIENLCTLVIDPDDERFLRVLPLTFCPLDDRLIDQAMLDHDEKKFLAYFKEQFYNNNPLPDLPPLSKTTFEAF